MMTSSRATGFHELRRRIDAHFVLEISNRSLPKTFAGFRIQPPQQSRQNAQRTFVYHRWARQTYSALNAATGKML